MNLFRSEEHTRTWTDFNPDVPDGLRPLSAWLERFAEPMFRERGRADYITWWTAWRASQQG